MGLLCMFSCTCGEVRDLKFWLCILSLNIYMHAWYYYHPNIINTEKIPKNALKRLKLFSFSQLGSARLKTAGIQGREISSPCGPVGLGNERKKVRITSSPSSKSTNTFLILLHLHDTTTSS